MNLPDLLRCYREDTRIEHLQRSLHNNPNRSIHLKGIVGTQLAFVLSGLHQRLTTPLVIVAANKENAAYLQNDLECIYAANGLAALFPDSFRRPYQFDRLDKTNVLQRTEAVSHLLHKTQWNGFIITYPEALFEKVVAPETLQKSVIEIRKGTQLDIKLMTEILKDYGFVEVNFVYEPGHFAIRGGIIDIFSYGNSLPYRIELFDEDIESIRTFDPTSQRSTQNIAAVNIVPNVNTQFKSSEKANLLQILPSSALLWIENVTELIEKIESGWDKSVKNPQLKGELLAQGLDEEVRLLEEQAFTSPEEIRQLLTQRSIVEYSVSPLFTPAQTINFATQPQPVFSKNFDRLIDNLKENHNKNIETFFFAENPKQIDRLRHIFEDLKAAVHWHPIDKEVNAGFVDADLGIAIYTDHQVFERFHRYRVRQGFDKQEALTLSKLGELRPGDFVTHLDHGVGRYAGLEKVDINGKVQEAVKLIYKDSDKLYVGIQSLHKISKYVGKEGESPTLHKLGSQVWENTKRKAKKQIKELAFDLIQLYAKRKATPGFAFPQDGYLQNELEASFVYEDTPDQAKATEDVKQDMMKPHPMDRLVCGDVGFGKTEVAIRAAFKAVTAGKQVAVLVPTTILALQHAQTFKDRLKEFGVTIDYLNRFRSTKEKNEIYKKIEAGSIEIIIGTHALLNQKVKFKDLGLLVIDEEQKFGVGSKEKIRNIKVDVDTLTLTATPIPRTLQFSLLAARDLSIINTPPPNRQPIHTEIRTFEEDFIKEAIENEVSRGGQVFFLHNRVESLNDMAAQLRRLCPTVGIAVAHGQMDASSLEQTLLDFIKGYHEVLVCTNIIETGLDIPNANTMIISNAHHFGLSDLHQLRGRVGRSNKKAYCYLLAPPMSVISSDSKKRLQTIEQFADLGSGFQIAMRDLDIRGAGNLLGAEQSGFIINMGYETYQKILNEAITELKQEEYKDLFKEELEVKGTYVSEVNIETDMEMLLPDSYVSSVEERLSLYQKLDKIEDEEGITKYRQELQDRFGTLPTATENLFDALRLRWVARQLGMERIIISNGKMRCYFLTNQEHYFFTNGQFDRILGYIQRHADHRFYLKQSDKHLFLVCDGVKTMEKCKTILHTIKTGCEG